MAPAKSIAQFWKKPSVHIGGYPIKDAAVALLKLQMVHKETMGFWVIRKHIDATLSMADAGQQIGEYLPSDLFKVEFDAKKKVVIVSGCFEGRTCKKAECPACGRGFPLRNAA